MDRNQADTKLSRGAEPSAAPISGAAVAAALQAASKLTCGTIVVVLPDRGDRYLSTGVFPA